MADQPTDSPGKVQEMLKASKNFDSAPGRSLFLFLQVQRETLASLTKSGSIERLIVQIRNIGADDESTQPHHKLARTGKKTHL